MKTTLLVASEEVDKWHHDHNVKYSWDNVERVTPLAPQAINVETYHHEVEEAPPLPKANGYDVPPLNPHSIQVNEEREISKMTTTTKTETISTNSASYQYKVSSQNKENSETVIITTCSFLNESTTAYDAYAAPPAGDSGDLMDQVFGKVNLPTVGTGAQVTIHSHTEELPEDASSVSSLSSSHRESAVDVPVSHQYVPSYATQSHQQHEQHSQTHHHHHHHQHQQPSPMSNGSSHGYAASSTSGYDDDDIYHLSASEARERLRMKNRKHHMNEMSLNEKYQLVSNM
ncbi:hypothetical protein CAEBREN_00623 [Caenorhabditis brenneri]|uniref:Uncharacterized protein n=1 Tax=Caenorhabditis brenneri TaxID=135651 RepID=G0NMM4_CAEBE|nr:hypothetical protein CAEBREN_00623 [Caenorhabditis brenneri]